MTSERAEEILNEIGTPEHDHPDHGGRVSYSMVQRYGTWLRRHDPIAFEVAKQDLERNDR